MAIIIDSAFSQKLKKILLITFDLMMLELIITY